MIDSYPQWAFLIDSIDNYVHSIHKTCKQLHIRIFISQMTNLFEKNGLSFKYSKFIKDLFWDWVAQQIDTKNIEIKENNNAIAAREQDRNNNDNSDRGDLHVRKVIDKGKVIASLQTQTVILKKVFFYDWKELDPRACKWPDSSEYTFDIFKDRSKSLMQLICNMIAANTDLLDMDDPTAWARSMSQYKNFWVLITQHANNVLLVGKPKINFVKLNMGPAKYNRDSHCAVGFNIRKMNNTFQSQILGMVQEYRVSHPSAFKHTKVITDETPLADLLKQKPFGFFNKDSQMSSMQDIKDAKKDLIQVHNTRLTAAKGKKPTSEMVLNNVITVLVNYMRELIDLGITGYRDRHGVHSIDEKVSEGLQIHLGGNDESLNEIEDKRLDWDIDIVGEFWSSCKTDLNKMGITKESESESFLIDILAYAFSNFNTLVDQLPKDLMFKSKHDVKGMDSISNRTDAFIFLMQVVKFSDNTLNESQPPTKRSFKYYWHELRKLAQIHDFPNHIYHVCSIIMFVLFLVFILLCD